MPNFDELNYVELIYYKTSHYSLLQAGQELLSDATLLQSGLSIISKYKSFALLQSGTRYIKMWVT